MNKIIGYQLFGELFKKGVAVVSDSCNLNKAARQAIIALARQAGYQVKIIWLSIPQNELLAKVPGMHPIFEPPTAEEADQLIVVDSLEVVLF